MRAERRIITTGKGVHGKRKSPLSSNRPLMRASSAHRTLFWFAALFLITGVLVQQNYSDIGAYINRPITKVRMDNKWQSISESEIAKLLSPFIGTGFFRFDVNGVKEDLEAHPWVANASIKRIWPDSVSLLITEEVAIARWGEAQLLNQYGEIFEPPEVRELRNLPLLVGSDEMQFRMMEQYKILSQILSPSGLKLTGLSLSARGSWDMTLDDGLTIAVGRTEINEKLERFVEFYSTQSTENSSQFAAVDLRYGNGIAIKNLERESLEQELTGIAIL